MGEPDPDRVTIFIVSARSLFSELLAYALHLETPATCEIVPEPAALVQRLSDAGPPSGGTLVLIDCIENDFEQVINALAEHGIEPGNELYMAIFNVYAGWGIESEALTVGVRAFFYRHDSMRLVLKGIEAVLRNEVWVSREVLMRSAVGGLRQRHSSTQEKTGLSVREIEILRRIAAGASNEAIAETLFLSPNTVKTHLYHIFRKIKVTSRIQAAAWAAKNL